MGVATALGKNDKGLSLNGLTTLPVEAAAALAEYTGDVLELNGLTTLSAEAAQTLAVYSGDIRLRTDPFRLRDALTLDSIGLLVLGGRKDYALMRLDTLTALDSPDAAAIADILVTVKGMVMLPNLKRLSPKTFETLAQKENLLLPEFDTLEFVLGPGGSGSADDVRVLEGFKKRQRDLRDVWIAPPFCDGE